MPSGNTSVAPPLRGCAPRLVEIPNCLNSRFLLHHVGRTILARASAFLTLMETECIDTVVMELFERVSD